MTRAKPWECCAELRDVAWILLPESCDLQLKRGGPITAGIETRLNEIERQTNAPRCFENAHSCVFLVVHQPQLLESALMKRTHQTGGEITGRHSNAEESGKNGGVLKGEPTCRSS